MKINDVEYEEDEYWQWQRDGLTMRDLLLKTGGVETWREGCAYLGWTKQQWDNTATTIRANQEYFGGTVPNVKAGRPKNVTHRGKERSTHKWEFVQPGENGDLFTIRLGAISSLNHIVSRSAHEVEAVREYISKGRNPVVRDRLTNCAAYMERAAIAAAGAIAAMDTDSRKEIAAVTVAN